MPMAEHLAAAYEYNIQLMIYSSTSHNFIDSIG